MTRADITRKVGSILLRYHIVVLNTYISRFEDGSFVLDTNEAQQTTEDAIELMVAYGVGRGEAIQLTQLVNLQISHMMPVIDKAVPGYVEIAGQG